MKNIDKEIKIGVIKSRRGKTHFKDCPFRPFTRGWKSNGFHSVMTYEELKLKANRRWDKNRLCKHCQKNLDKEVEKAIDELPDELITDLIFKGDPFSRKVALQIRKERKAKTKPHQDT